MELKEKELREIKDFEDFVFNNNTKIRYTYYRHDNILSMIFLRKSIYDTSERDVSYIINFSLLEKKITFFRVNNPFLILEIKEFSNLENKLYNFLYLKLVHFISNKNVTIKNELYDIIVEKITKIVFQINIMNIYKSN